MNRPLLTSLLLLALAGCKTDDSTQQSTKWIPRQQPKGSSNQQQATITNALTIEAVRGKQFITNKSLLISANKSLNTIEFSISIHLGDTVRIPKVYNSAFREYEDADHLEVTLKDLTKKSKQFSVKKEKTSLSRGSATFTITMNEDDFHTLPMGKDSLLFEINFKFMSFFGKYSAEKIPISAVVKVPFEIKPIYESRAYFKSLKLNKQQTLKKLGGEDNDFGDGTPEACVFISSNNKTIIYQKSKNSYTVNQPRTEIFYHSEPNPYINIGAYDADYGLNFDDLLGDTLLRLKNLTFPTYQNIKVDCTEELNVYFTTKGQINK